MVFCWSIGNSFQPKKVESLAIKNLGIIVTLQAAVCVFLVQLEYYQHYFLI